MHDIVDVIKNLETLSDNNNAFTILKEFEKVLDELDIYVYRNWEDGELIEGPIVDRYSVTCKFMWDRDEMPDPEAGKLLNDYGCNVKYIKTHILIPRKITDPDDYRPGTKKGKIDAHPIWIVAIQMPKKLIQDVSVGKETKENAQMAELMRYNKNQIDMANVAQETPNEPAAEA